MKKTMLALLPAMVLAFAASSAFAEPQCDVPQEKWMKEAAFKAKAEAEGCQLKTFTVNKVQCYEISGTQDGKKTEAWFNPETGASLGAKSG